MTIYECQKPQNDVNRTPITIHYANTEREAIEWLERNGGGIYHNKLHGFKCNVSTKKA